MANTPRSKRANAAAISAGRTRSMSGWRKLSFSRGWMIHEPSGHVVNWQRVTTNRAYLDTNVLVQFRPMNEIDWCRLLAADSVQLVLIPAVIRELEQMKHGDNRRLKKRATAVLELVEKMLSESMVGQVRPNVTITFDAFEPKLDFDANGLSRQIVDDWVLATLIERAEPSAVLVTDDMSLDLKARHRNLRSVRPPDHLRLPPDEDEEVKRLRADLRAAQHQLGKAPEVVMTLSDGKAFMEHTEQNVDRRPTPAQRATEKDKELREQLREAVQLEVARRSSGITPHLASLRGLERAPFDEAELQRYIVQLRRYHEHCDGYAILRARSFKFILVIHNRGLAPAEGIHIRLDVPREVTYLDGTELDGVYEPEVPAYFRSPFERSKTLDRHIESAVRSIATRDVPPPWRWHFDDVHSTLAITVDSLVHTKSRPLPELRMAFPIESNSPRGFELGGSIVISKPPNDIPVRLHFVPT